VVVMTIALLLPSATATVGPETNYFHVFTPSHTGPTIFNNLYCVL
jgi:hypothetical protein